MRRRWSNRFLLFALKHLLQNLGHWAVFCYASRNPVSPGVKEMKYIYKRLICLAFESWSTLPQAHSVLVPVKR